MAENSRSRRVRIDAIINSIVKGEYDDKLPELKAAIDERNKARQDDVLKLVAEVFGPEAVVQNPADVPDSPATGNVFIDKARAEGAAVEPLKPIPLDADGNPIEVPEPEEGDPFPMTEAEAQMANDIENRGSSISGIGPGDIA